MAPRTSPDSSKFDDFLTESSMKKAGDVRHVWRASFFSDGWIVHSYGPSYTSYKYL